MLSPAEKIIFSFLILATAAAFLIPMIYRIRIILSAQKEKRFDGFPKRLWYAFTKVLFQRCTLRSERILTGIIHVGIFYGALTFDTLTLNHTLEGYIPHFYLFGDTGLGLFFSLLVDVFAILVLLGVVFFLVRRYIIRYKAYNTTPLDSGLIYFFLTTATLSYLYFKCFSILHHPETERLAFLGSFLAQFVQNSGLSSELVAVHFNISWWLHIVIVFAFIAYVPHSKYFHMFTSPFNLLFHSDKSKGELKSLDIENSEIFGIEKATDYTWKDLLDSFACMECGRCQDACPTFASEKPLSPKMIIFNMRNHLLEQGQKYIKKKREEISPLMDEVHTPGEIWTCTTCGACMQVCPAEIEHIPKIVGVRQGQVLMEGKFPTELNNFFKSMETNSNPWGVGFADRANWAEGLDVKLMSDHPEAEYLFWVGCAGSFDEQGKKIAKAMVKILNEAGVDFAILGTEEKCCGDSVKRLGNEYLFQMMAGENIEQFKKYNVQKIITTCPHGYNAFKNDYPRLLDFLPDLSSEDKKRLKNIEIIHHVQLINQLIKEGRLSLKSPIKKYFTYHDSCYLGRHNDLIEEPREILSAVSESKIVELENNREHSFCCGAGGGLMWTEESLGNRINHMRTDEVLDKKVYLTVTSCPFCQTMFLDGLKDKQIEDIQVKDIAEVVAECLSDSTQSS